MRNTFRLILTVSLLITIVAAGCGGSASQPAAGLNLAPESQLPAQLRSAPANVQEAYRFAIANQELLSQIPCFCGCGAVGHKSNLSCYLVEDGEPGILQYDYHALG